MQVHREIGLFVLFRMEKLEQVKIHSLCIPKVLSLSVVSDSL